MTFSNTSKTLRKEKGLSQVQLAEALNISKACISMIEIGKNEPTANTLLKYADFFQCSTDYLLGREDDFGNITIQTEKPEGFEESRKVAKKGGEATKQARQSIEEVIGEKIVSPLNASEKEKLVTEKLPEISEITEPKE